MLHSIPRWRSILTVLLFMLISLSVYISCNHSFTRSISTLSSESTQPRPTPWLHPDFYTPSHWRSPSPQQEVLSPEPEPSSDKNRIDNFPYAAHLKSSSKLPPIPSWNDLPSIQLAFDAPLFIPYTGNWALLQQTVISFLTSGWPAGEIYVLNNAPSSDSVSRGLDAYRLMAIFKVSILSTPKSMSEAEMRSYVLQTAVERNWEQFFVARDNVIALSNESYVDADSRNVTTSSLYARAVEAVKGVKGENEKWARAMVDAEGALMAYNTRALASLPSDEINSFSGCTDLELRFSREKNEFALHSTQGDGRDRAGILVFRVEESLEDLLVLYRRKGIMKIRGDLREAIAETKTGAVSPWGEEDKKGGKGWDELVGRVKSLKKPKEAVRC